MGVYLGSLTVPPNTNPSNPVQLVISPGNRSLTGVSISFPDGVLGSVGVRVSDYGSQFFPQSGWIYGNNNNPGWGGLKLLEGPPFRVVIEAYSIAEDWPHTLQIQVTTV